MPDQSKDDLSSKEASSDKPSFSLPTIGGYGDPRERDRELLMRDVRDGKVSCESALRDYGVEIEE